MSISQVDFFRTTSYLVDVNLTNLSDFATLDDYIRDERASLASMLATMESVVAEINHEDMADLFGGNNHEDMAVLGAGINHENMAVVEGINNEDVAVPVDGINHEVPDVLPNFKRITADECDEICSICLDDVTENINCVLSCNHGFHEICLRRWFQRKRSCPLCRFDYSS
ncbi:E3 ubiquitin-protein ligase RNF181 homolog [Chenopodium quinoa]|uniref:E3 ubiquitin-protein ligase RNF181 homolog n=1 Tax=Chenopodium quinoa TaxID=63459 RepID=UPI000B78A4FD|nr:E3 ubiquitin-protein ligase RNF181 homolog [Chenopodium quinoa]